MYGGLQVQRTSDNVAAAGRSAWRATKWTTKRAVEAPLHLMHLLGGNHSDGDDDEGYDESSSRHSGLRDALRQARSAERFLLVELSASRLKTVGAALLNECPSVWL